MFRTISWQEVIWTAFSLIGLGFNTRSLFDARDDREALIEAPDYIEDGPRDLVAKNAITTAWIGVSLQALFAIIGIIAMILPPNPADHTSTTQTALATFFLAASAALAWASYRNATYRRRVLDAIRLSEESKSTLEGETA